ncbi:hypothetical protein HDV03_001874 [Kappamyces sp. JEL0829]|nr:hypothetical protein HDV03_001874 [Kappamyces sp. JEL0829]KAJ3369553.1 hypothetical protein HDU91_007113 [Kappamyces sp. JEL0680]
MSDTEEMPVLEGLDERNISKSELKARKAMAKLGLKAVPDVERVVIRRANNSLFVIAQADVYKTINGDTHVVFGDAKMEEAMTQQEAAQKLMGDVVAPAPAASAEAAPADDDDEEVDEEGIEPNDIEMVMNQANVSRAKAVKALRANNNDIVNSIMELNVEN